MTTAKTMNRDRPPAVAAGGAGVKKTTPAASTTPPPPAAPATARADAVALAARSKAKLVRDSFTIPKSEYAVLEALKHRAARLMRPTKKSEVLRAGVMALEAMSDKAFLAAIEAVPSLKTGRPKAPGKAAPE